MRNIGEGDSWKLFQPRVIVAETDNADRCCEEASGRKIISLAAVILFFKFHNFINLISMWGKTMKNALDITEVI